MPRKNSYAFAVKRKYKRKKSLKSMSPSKKANMKSSDLGSWYQEWSSTEEKKDSEPEEETEDLNLSASKRKLMTDVADLPMERSSLPGEEEVEDPWQSPQGLTLVDGEILMRNIDKMATCRFCHEDVSLLENRNQKQGLGKTWRLRCSNSDCVSGRSDTFFPTSTKRAHGFEVNWLLNLGMRSVGRGHAASEKLLSIMNLGKLVQQEYWSNHTSAIEKAAKELLDKEFDDAALEVKRLKVSSGDIPACSDEELAQKVVDVGITIDGSWCSRGWCTTDALIAVISVDTGKVLDAVHMCNTCGECKRAENRQSKGELSKMEYLKWYIDHEPTCFRNHQGSAASMEATVILYQRSQLVRNLRYIPFIGDGDSKSYSEVVKCQPYGAAVFIPKEECISHVTKRMGSNLRSILRDYKGKKLSDGKALSGVGRLTLSRVDTLQNFYGRAIRDNKGDAKAMAKATQAILKHYSSTPEDPQHEDCPQGPDSWCSYQRDQARKTCQHKPIKNPIPPAVVEVVKPIFNRLGSEEFLVGCEKCYTQNPNESLHHVVWGIAPKDGFNSPQEISTAISLGILQFNRGCAFTYKQIISSLGIKVTPKMSDGLVSIDNLRLKFAEYRASEAVKKQRKLKRRSKLKQQDAFVHQEGVSYKSQAFHGTGGKKEGKPRKGEKCNK